MIFEPIGSSAKWGTYLAKRLALSPMRQYEFPFDPHHLGVPPFAQNDFWA
jgi:hypothetical protein